MLMCMALLAPPRHKYCQSTAIGTHDIKMAEILPSTINITYFTGSNARGALLNQVCSMNATSTFQMLDRSSQFLAPYNYTAPTCCGQVQIFLYDIEGSGTLSRGGNYPAVKQKVAGNRQGIVVSKVSEAIVRS